MDWNKLIDAARAENEHGIAMQRGKKYTSTAKRVDLMRRHLGALGLATEIVQWDPVKGALIVVKATITDETGRVLATGHAEEIRGQGNVNQTSALENAETSAIGRALAALGISGGEFASANEMDGVERKTEAQKDAPAKAKAAKPAPLKDQMPPPVDDLEPAPPIPIVKVKKALLLKVMGAADYGDLDRMVGLKSFDAYLDRLFREDREGWMEVCGLIETRRAELTPQLDDDLPEHLGGRPDDALAALRSGASRADA